MLKGKRQGGLMLRVGGETSTKRQKCVMLQVNNDQEARCSVR